MANSNSQSAERVTFHVPPAASPNDTLALLNTIKERPDVEFTTWALLSAAAYSRYDAGKRPQDSHKVAQMTGLLLSPARAGKATLTPLAEIILSAREDSQVELIHYLMYTGWDAARPSHHGPMWSYRKVCSILWDTNESSVMPKEVSKPLYDAVDADGDFANVPKEHRDKKSISGKTVQGVLKWLAQLCPPAVTGEKDKSKEQLVFQRRGSCTRELLLLGLAWIFRDQLPEADEEGRLLSADLLLTDERRAALCRLALLDPAHLDRLLDSILATYPQYLREGIRTGTMARYVRLLRLPQLENGDVVL